MRDTLHNLLTVFSVISAVLLICLLILYIFGFRPFILESSSMEPTITKGSLVFAHSIPLEEIKDGSTVIYRVKKLLVLHRYLGDGKFQGDANTIAQNVELNETNFVGIYAFHIPGIGALVSFLIKNSWLLWGLVGLTVILACIRFKKPVSST